VPATSKEHFDALADHGAISPDLAAGLRGAAGLRNPIAHAYGRIDFARLYAEAPPGLEALERFAAAIATRAGS
jgi:uncharacterized protein YutE (UPF0331/DUF86 family)